MHRRSARWSSPLAGAALGVVLMTLAMVAPAVSTDSPAGASVAAWVVVPSPNQPGAYANGLSSVSCPTATECEAVGVSYGATPNQPSLPLAEHAQGTAWTRQPVPVPAGETGALRAVSCPTATFCVAVGSAYALTTGRTVPLVEQWNGTAWAAVQVATALRGYYTAVSCSSATSCMAVGTQIGTSTTILTPPTSASWDGHTWTVHPITLPAGYSYGSLQAVSCPSAVFCMATGLAHGPHVTLSGLQERWDGTNWSTLPLSEPAGTPTGATLDAVSCPTATWCLGVGGFIAGPAGQFVDFTEVWTGSAWQPPQNPAGGASLSGVTCTAPSSCLVVGANGSSALMLPLTAGTWGYQALPTFQSANRLTAISCRAGDACVAVGSYVTAGGAGTLVEGRGVALASPGYRLVAADGGVFAFTAPFYGSMGGQPLNAPIVGMATDPSTGGYWLVATDGGVFAFTAPFYGSMGGQPLNAPVVGMAAAPTGGGYWLVAADGGVFSFGPAAVFAGSMGGQPLNAPIVGMEAAAPSTGSGYWLVAADGGVFAFTAPFYGSRATGPVLGPVVGLATDPTVGGYRITTTRGTITDVGRQPDFGTLAGLTLAAPVVALVDDSGTGGYWMVAADGGVFGFDAPFQGSMGGTQLVAPIVGGAAAAAP